MRVGDVKKLHQGDEVYWNDPDEGKCSRYYTIRTIESHGCVVRIVDINGDVLECFARELS